MGLPWPLWRTMAQAVLRPGEEKELVSPMMALRRKEKWVIPLISSIEEVVSRDTGRCR